MTLRHQDPVIAGALADVVVPSSSDEFWARLEGRLTRVDDVHALPPLVPRSPAAAPLLFLPEPPPPSPSGAGGWTWRVLAAAAAAFVVVAIVVSIGRDPTAVDVPAGPPPDTDLPPVTASPTDVLVAYKHARDTGDERTAAALLGPRASADVAAGKLPPYQPASELPPLPPGAQRVEPPVGWGDGTRELVLNDQAVLVAMGTASPYRMTFVMWREGPGHRWLVEGSHAGPTQYPDGSGGGYGLRDGNGVDITMAIPGAGHAWVFIDGVLHADTEAPGTAWWPVPAVPATSSDLDAGREVITVFVGPHTVQSEGTRLGGPK
jgi:hypothetical protein